MVTFYQVGDSGEMKKVDFSDLSDFALKDECHLDSLSKDTLNFDELLDKGIYTYSGFDGTEKEDGNWPSALTSGYVVVMVEDDSRAQRGITQMVLDDNNGSYYRRGILSETENVFEDWHSLNANNNSITNLSLGKGSPSAIDGIWTEVSNLPYNIQLWKQINGISTLSERDNRPKVKTRARRLISTTSETNVILNGIETLALTGAQTIYVRDSTGAFSKLCLDISNGGTGATTVEQARLQLETHYDLQVLLGTYPGRDLMVVFADEIAEYTDEAEWFNARVMSGDITGIRPFDYFDITLTDGKVFRYRCAAYDPYLGACDTEITVHHMIMVPDQVWPDSVPWNTTNTNQGTASEKHPYLASNLHRWEVNTFYPLLPAKWKNVIATHRALLEERYSASSSLTDSTGWSWADLGKVWSLSETEVYGEVVWGTKAWSKGYDCHFATFFALTRHRIRRNFSDDRYAWWLRGAYGGNATNACDVGYGGGAGGSSTSNAGVRALPCFRVGV